MSSLTVVFLDGEELHLEDVSEGNSNSPHVLQVKSNGSVYSFPTTSVKYVVATP